MNKVVGTPIHNVSRNRSTAKDAGRRSGDRSPTRVGRAQAPPSLSRARPGRHPSDGHQRRRRGPMILSLIHISEPTRQAEISYAVFCLKKKKNTIIRQTSKQSTSYRSDQVGALKARE